MLKSGSWDLDVELFNDFKSMIFWDLSSVFLIIKNEEDFDQTPLCLRGVFIIATPYASGFDYFLIADEVQFKFDRCHRAFSESVSFLFLSFFSLSFVMRKIIFSIFS